MPPSTILRRNTIWSFHSRTATLKFFNRGKRAGEFGQLMIMRREQRFGANLIVQMLHDGPRQAQTVERAGAAADFIQDDKAARVALFKMFAVSHISTMKVD